MICFPIVQAFGWTRRSLKERKARKRAQETPQQQTGNHAAPKKLLKKKSPAAMPAELNAENAEVEAHLPKDPVETDGTERPVEADHANVQVAVEGEDVVTEVENVQGSSRTRRTIDSYYDGLTPFHTGQLNTGSARNQSASARGSIVQTPVRYYGPGEFPATKG